MLSTHTLSLALSVMFQTHTHTHLPILQLLYFFSHLDCLSGTKQSIFVKLFILHILHYFQTHTFILYTKCLTNLHELFLMTLKDVILNIIGYPIQIDLYFDINCIVFSILYFPLCFLFSYILFAFIDTIQGKPY